MLNHVDAAPYGANPKHAQRALARLGVSSVPYGWKLSTVGKACTIRNELRLPLSVEVRGTMQGKYPYYGPTGILDHVNKYRVDGDFALIGEDGDHFLDATKKSQTIRVSGRLNVNNHAHLVAGGPACAADWFFHFFRHRDISHSLTRQGAGRFKLTKQSLEKLPILLPPFREQHKIAEILRVWDDALDKLNALRSAKCRAAASMRQKLFENEYASTEWLRRARDLFETVSERARPDLPLLAVMQDLGIVRRDELDRRVAMPDGDTSGYKVVRPGDFVISLRSFEGGLEYSAITGLVSPAYTVLRPTADLISDYYKHFFKSSSFIGRLDRLIFGIRDGKQIAFRDFGDMLIPAPPLEEQRKQATVLASIEDEIALIGRQVEAIARQKRGLMQKLLTGEWRVTPESVEERGVSA